MFVSITRTQELRRAPAMESQLTRHHMAVIPTTDTPATTKLQAPTLEPKPPVAMLPYRKEGLPREESERVIEPRPGCAPIDLRELYRYRDLLWFNTWRGVRARYAQSSLGHWLGRGATSYIICLVYTLIFGYVSRIQLSEGVPYACLVFFAGSFPGAFSPVP